MNKVNFEKTALKKGYNFDKLSKTIYGENKGYTWSINNEISYGVLYGQIKFCISRIEGRLDSEEIRELKLRCIYIDKVLYNGSVLILPVKLVNDDIKSLEMIESTIKDVCDFLSEKNFENSCECCGLYSKTSPIFIVGRIKHLCRDCYEKNKNEFQIKEDDTCEENIYTGLIGALIGSIVGIILVRAFSNMYVLLPAVSVVFALFTFRGYVVFGKSISKKGAIYCLVIMMFMVYLADMIDWIILISVKLNITIQDSLKLFFTEKYVEIGVYVKNLVIQYLLVMIGVIPVFISKLNKEDKLHMFYALDVNFKNNI